MCSWLAGSSATRRHSAHRRVVELGPAGWHSLARPHSTARAPVERVAGQQQALGALEPEAVGPHRGRRRAPDAGRRIADAAVLGADDQVAAQGEVGAAADAEAVHLGDDRLGRAPQGHVGVDEARHHRQVGHRVPRPAGLGLLHRLRRPSRCRSRRRTRGRRRLQPDDPHVVVALGLLQPRPARPRASSWRDRVQALGPVERQRRNCAVGLQQDRGGHCPTLE